MLLGGGNESDYDSWLGTACQSCQMIFCEDCQDACSPSPCRNCGKPVVPAMRNYLPAIPNKLSMEKPPFSRESLPISQQSEIKKSLTNETINWRKRKKILRLPKKILNKTHRQNQNQKRIYNGHIALFDGIVGFIVYYITSEPQRMYDQAKAFHENGSYTAAITSYNELINKHPESQLAIKASQDISVVFYDQAHDYHDNGLLDESIATYKSIIANYPESQSAIKASKELPLVFYDQAHDFHENGSLDESIATYKDIITNFPDSQSAIKASQDLPLVIAEQYCQSSDSGSSVNDSNH